MDCGAWFAFVRSWVSYDLARRRDGRVRCFLADEAVSTAVSMGLPPSGAAGARWGVRWCSSAPGLRGFF